jgi:hypothetical protein
MKFNSSLHTQNEIEIDRRPVVVTGKQKIQILVSGMDATGQDM